MKFSGEEPIFSPVSLLNNMRVSLHLHGHGAPNLPSQFFLAKIVRCFFVP